MSNFETIQIGDEASLEQVVTNADLRIFAQLTGDENPLHVDAAYAAATTFKEPIVHGMLTASYLSTLVGMYLPGKGSLLAGLNLDFRKPVKIGDQLKLTLQVSKKISLSKIVVLKVTATNQHSEVVMSGTAKALCPE